MECVRQGNKPILCAARDKKSSLPKLRAAKAHPGLLRWYLCFDRTRFSDPMKEPGSAADIIHQASWHAVPARKPDGLNERSDRQTRR